MGLLASIIQQARMITARTFIRIVESNMNYTETITKLRSLARGEDCCDDELFTTLSSQGCHYLILKSKSYASRQSVTFAVNYIMQEMRYQVCKSVTDMLEAESIPYAHIKGAALSQRIYGNPAYRSSGDIDLLVPRCILTKRSQYLSVPASFRESLLTAE